MSQWVEAPCFLGIKMHHLSYLEKELDNGKMEPLISLPLDVLADLLASHSKLAQAEYDRNPSYNDSHFSEKAGSRVIDYLQKNDQWETVLQRLMKKASE
jgi:hypothetical protein